MAVPINNVTRRVVYAASGTGPYNFTFEILAAGDIAVYRDDTLLTLTTNYTVTINTNGTGFVTLTATPTGATQIAIVGNRTIQRTTDFVTGGDFFANTLNDELDQQTIFSQQNAEGLQRALIAPQTDPTTIDMTLPRAADRANKTLAFDANGDPTLGISAADVANAVTYATNAANSATAAAASASSASSSASSASSSASTATTQASNASTSASNASTSATSASNSASSASTSATNASNSASAASTSATNAANSASAASTSASNAASAQSAAESARDATLAAYDSFDDRYLGTKTSDPTLDNDGNALVAGALYYRSTSPIGMKVYTGSQWVDAYADGNSFVAKAGDTMTGGLTVPSLTDSGNLTFTGTGNRITGDFSNATVANRVMFQTSTTNGNTVLNLIPNGTGTVCAFGMDSDPALTNSSTGSLNLVAGTDVRLAAGIRGTGTYLPMTFYTGGSERMQINTSGNVGIGLTSPATKLDVVGPSSVTSFASTSALGVRVRGASSTNDYSGIDFSTTNQASPTARIGAYFSGSGSYLQFGTSNSYGSGVTNTAMTIDYSGNVGIGTTSPESFGGGHKTLELSGSTTTEGGVFKTATSGSAGSGSSGTEMIMFTDSVGGKINVVSSHPAIFYTANTERARIDSSGNLLVGQTSQTASEKFGVTQSSATASTARFYASNTSYTNDIVQISCARSGATTEYNALTVFDNNATLKMLIRANGNLLNSNNSYGSLSDQRLKENIVDATPKLEKMNQVRIVNFNMIGDSQKQIGVVAQELEQIFPGIVEEDRDGMKGVKYSVFVPMLIKAMQEQQAMIEELKADIAALKGA